MQLAGGGRQMTMIAWFSAPRSTRSGSLKPSSSGGRTWRWRTLPTRSSADWASGSEVKRSTARGQGVKEGRRSAVRLGSSQRLWGPQSKAHLTAPGKPKNDLRRVQHLHGALGTAESLFGSAIFSLLNITSTLLKACLVFLWCCIMFYHALSCFHVFLKSRIWGVWTPHFWPVILQEEEKDATNGEGSASLISALSGSMLSHGHDLSHLRKDRRGGCRNGIEDSWTNIYQVRLPNDS